MNRFLIFIGSILTVAAAAASTGCRANRIDQHSLFGPTRASDGQRSGSRPTVQEFALLAKIIEEELVWTQIEDNDVAGITGVARKMLYDDQYKQQQKGGSSQKGLLKFVKRSDKVSEETLKLFVKLPTVMLWCDHEAFIAIKENFQLAVGNKDYLEPTCKLNKAILRTMEMNSQKCRHLYLEEFSDLQIMVSETVRDDVDKFIDDQVIRETFPSSNFRDLVRMSRAQITERLVNNPKPIYGKIVKLAQEEENLEPFASVDQQFGKIYVTDRDHFRFQTLQEYIVAPCAEYVMNYARVFSKARFSLALDDTKVDDIVQGDKEMIDTWTKYRVCESIWLEEEKVTKAIADVYVW